MPKSRFQMWPHPKNDEIRLNTPTSSMGLVTKEWFDSMRGDFTIYRVSVAYVGRAHITTVETRPRDS